MAPTDHVESRPEHHVFRGAAWLIAARWSVRLMGLVSTLLLARLLTPVDYGIVALASLVVGFAEVFSQAGQFDAVMRHVQPTPEHYDTAWTFALLVSSILGGILWFVAPWAAVLLHEPRAALVIQILGLRTMILGFQNSGVVNFSRRLDFQMQFYFDCVPKLFSLFVTIASAIILRNYWALVIGLMSTTLARVLLSFVMEPHRPRISFRRAREMWHFSFWSQIRTFGIYANAQIDKFAVAGLAGSGPAGMGRYDVARDLATSFSQELINPVSNALMPVMAKVQADKTRSRDLYLSTLSWVALISSSVSVGVALVAEDICDVILGPRWHEAWVLIPWFALTWGLVGLTSGVSSVLLALGHAYTSARQQWARVAAYAFAVFAAAYFLRSLEAIAIARFVMTLMLSPALFVVIGLVLDIPMRDFAKVLWRPIAASAVMAAMVLMINANVSVVGMLRLILDVAVGAAAYGVALATLWVAAGRPLGLEHTIWEYLRMRFPIFLSQRSKEERP